MKRSLRLRVFLTVWPMVVVALTVVGLQFGRWVRVEVDRLAPPPAVEPQAPSRLPSRTAISMMPLSPSNGATSSLRALADDAWRMIWTTVALASVVAAAATLLLAGPIIAQVRRLADVSARLRAGALDARVPVTTRDELGTLERAFNEMAASLERAEGAKRTLISDLSHELRTPLTNVIWLLEAMKDGLRAPDTATIDSAREEAALLAKLVDDLQQLSTAEAGALRYDIESLDAVSEARAAVVACRPLEGPRVELPPMPVQPVRMLADRQRVAQVLRNLLRNAIAHTPTDGIVRVEVSTVGSDRVSLSVVDTGEGIPAEQLPLVWERFHRVDPSRSRRTGGMGLGLAIVRQLVQGMGGDVSAESTPGVGSRFTVLLPAAVSRNPSSEPA